MTTLLLVFALAWSIRLNVVLACERALRAEFVELVGQQQELVLEIVDSGKTTRRVLRSTSESSNAYGKVFTALTWPMWWRWRRAYLSRRPVKRITSGWRGVKQPNWPVC